MSNLIWESKKATKKLSEMPFGSETEFEKSVFDAQLLEEVFLIKRQVRGGGKSGIPDIIGIDTEGSVCIIEMKNVRVDSSIIPQVLQYAFWAESNPDSIKTLWHECETKPDDLTVNWEDYSVKIIIVAPSISKGTLGIVGKIAYAVDLIEVKRWRDGEDVFIFFNKIEEDESQRTRPVKGLEEYNLDFYTKQHNKKSAVQFMDYAKKLERFVNKNGWELKLKFNKQYCSYQAGFFNAFGIVWVGTTTFAFFMKIPLEFAEKAKMKCTKYQTQWKQALYYIDPDNTKIEDYRSLFEMAYKRLTGK